MADYRFYCFDGRNKITDGEYFNASSDEEALEIVRKMQRPARCEVWQSARFVAQVDPPR